jgi:hypothetical protein
MGVVMMLMSLPKVWWRPTTNMAWYGIVWYSRPIDQLKPYFVSIKNGRFGHNYDLMLVWFNVLAKCCVQENFKSKSYWKGAIKQQALSTYTYDTHITLTRM